MTWTMITLLMLGGRMELKWLHLTCRYGVCNVCLYCSFEYCLKNLFLFQWQGYDKSLWLMHGMFRSNAGCGCVKKPNFLMNYGPDGKVFDPKEKLPVKKTLKVSMLYIYI